MRHVTSAFVGTVLLTSALLASPSPAQTSSVVFAGVEHSPLGASTLAVDATRTVLTIDGLNANGGGVSYRLDAEAGSIHFGDGVRGRRTPSGSWNVRATYRHGGGSSGAVGGGVNAAGDPLLTFDHGPVGTNFVTVSLRQGGQVVASFDDSPLVTLPAEEWPAEVELGIDQGEMVGGARFEQPVSVWLPDGTVVQCEEVITRSATGGTLQGEEIGTVTFEAFGLDEVQFEGERLRVDGSWFEIEGNLELGQSMLGHELTHVSQDGSPGTYTEFAAAPCVPPVPEEPARVRAGLEFDSILATGPPEVGTRTDFLIRGRLGAQGETDIPSHSKEWSNFNDSDPGVALIGGFVELGAVSWTVQVFDDGLLVDSEGGLGAEVARVKEFVTQRDQVDLDFLNQRAAAHVDLGVDQEVTILASVPRTVTGDRVHIIPEQIQLFPDCVEAVGTRVRKVSDVTLKRGVIDAPLPPARVFGLTHTVFGDAILSRRSGSIELLNEAWGPSTVGPSEGGARRVSAGLGGYRWRLAGDLDPQTLPEGSERSFRLATEDVNGQTGSVGLDVVVQNGLFSIAHDFDDLGSSDAEVEAWLDGQRVYSGVQQQQGRVLVDADFDTASVFELEGDLYAFELAWDTPQNLVIDGESVTANRVSERLRHRDRAVTVEDYEVVARETPGVTVARVSVRPSGAWWSAVGDVAFGDFTGNPLWIDLLDPSTPGGLEVESQEDPQGTAFVQAVLEDPSQYEVLDGDENLTLEVEEDDDGSAKGAIPVGVLSLARESARWSASLDFVAAGYTQFRVLADGFGEVHFSASASGPAFTTHGWPRTWVIRGVADGLWIDLGYPTGVLVEAPDGSTVTTSGLTVVVEGAPRPPFGAGDARFLLEGLSSAAVGLVEAVVGVGDDDSVTADPGRGVVFRGAAPNPFNPRTELSYALARASRVEIVVHDVAGRRVRTLVDGPRSAGEHSIVWNGRDEAGHEVASGVYLVRVTASGEQAKQKVVLVR